MTRNSLHEDRQKDREPDANTAHDHARFNFVVTLNFRRDAHATFQLELPHLGHLARLEHLREPRVAPLKLLCRVGRVQCLAHRLQVRSTKRAELYVVTLVRGTTRTQHKQLLFGEITKGYDDCTVSVLIRESHAKAQRKQSHKVKSNFAALRLCVK